LTTQASPLRQSRDTFGGGIIDFMFLNTDTLLNKLSHVFQKLNFVRSVTGSIFSNKNFKIET
jgi:hypothetical protein